MYNIGSLFIGKQLLGSALWNSNGETGILIEIAFKRPETHQILI